ncbi:MAG TPA: ATP-dependent 6-phosphofructokinase [Spirochaetia bacterium]|nr:ATP-dependent 6-phosphofructokinase [Spirochaetia bacterium]
MEDLKLEKKDLEVASLGEARIPSPLGLGSIGGDGEVDYVPEGRGVLYDTDRDRVVSAVKSGADVPAFEGAGPRRNIFFDPARVKAAIVTCGGLCPGINNVVRTLVFELHYRYGVRSILGIRYGYRGFIPKYGYEPLPLSPEDVKDIHERGGSFLSSSRGEQDAGEIVDFLQRKGIALLFTIGGDGTLRGALDIHREVTKRKLPISVIGIPKTIDNDIAFVERTFGLETAFSVAADSIRSAHTEAIGAPNGIGIVKVMGRMSGYIAANAALALNEVNFCLIPEVPFGMDGSFGLCALTEQRLRQRDHAVIIVAEGAGQEYVEDKTGKKDESGNPVLGDIGVFLKTSLKDYFKKNTDLYVNIKYIDPSYMVRSVAANAHDAIYCIQLAQNAVHAGMAGKTGMIIGQWNGQFTHVPIALAISRRKVLSTEDPLWLSVLESTGQPMRIGGGTPAREGID